VSPEAGGTQPERTRLAWRRTQLTVTVVALLALRGALRSDIPWVRPLGAVATMLIWLSALVVGHRRIRMLAAGEPHGLGEPGALLAAGVAVGLAALGLVLLAGP
jgi:hypothetical protein